MSMTFDIPADVQAGVADIPDLDLRIIAFLRHEAQLEALRRDRHSVNARTIVAEAVRQAEADKVAGFDWDESFAQLRQAHKDLTSRL
jgi:glutamyl-tRNA reductase